MAMVPLGFLHFSYTLVERTLVRMLVYWIGLLVRRSLINLVFHSRPADSPCSFGLLTSYLPVSRPTNQLCSVRNTQVLALHYAAE